MSKRARTGRSRIGYVVSIVAVAASLAAVAPGFADSSAGPPPGPEYADDPTYPADLDFSGTPAAERAKAEHDRLQAIGRSPEHKALRQRLAQQFGGQTASEALDTLKENFGDVLSSPPYAPLEMADRVLSYPSPFVARVEVPGGDTRLVQTMVPNRAEDSDGEMHPVDLGVTQGDQSFRAANPLVDVSIFKDFNRGIRFDQQGYSVRLSGASSTDPLKEVEGKVVTTNLVKDTDAIITPTPTGVEEDLLVRSSDAPAETAMQFDLGEGGSLRQLPDSLGGPVAATGVQIVRDGEPVASVSAPTATDSQGRSVPVSYHIEGDKLALELPKCGATIACPYLVDPVIDNYQVDTGGNRSTTQTADPFSYWKAYVTSPPKDSAGRDYARNAGPLQDDQINGYSPDPGNNGGYGSRYGFYLYRGYGGGFGNGLFAYAPAGTSSAPRYLLAGQQAQFDWSAPGDAYITQATFGGVTHQPTGTCLIEGIWAQRKPGGANYDTGSYTDPAGASGASPWQGYNQGSGLADACGAQNNDTKIHTISNPTPGNEAAFAIKSFYSFAVNTQATAFMYGAAFVLDDAQAPTVTPSSVTTTLTPPGGSAKPLDNTLGWVKDGTIRATAELYDPGLGVQALKLSTDRDEAGNTGTVLGEVDGPTDLAQTTKGATSSYCTGGKDARCPRVLRAGYGTAPNAGALTADISAKDANGKYKIAEGARTLTLAANDPIATTSHTQQIATLPIKIDRISPTIGAVSGFLVDAEGRLYSDGAYDASFSASDATSGIDRVELRLEDGSVLDSSSCSGSGDCTANLTFEPTTSHAGDHTVTAVAVDRAGNVARSAGIAVNVDASVDDLATGDQRDPVDDLETDGFDGVPSTTDGNPPNGFCGPGSASPDVQCDPNEPTYSDADRAAMAEPSLVSGLAAPLLVGDVTRFLTAGGASTRTANQGPGSIQDLNRGAKGWGISDQKAGRAGRSPQLGLFNTQAPDDPSKSAIADLSVDHVRYVTPFDTVVRAKDAATYPKRHSPRCDESPSGTADTIAVSQSKGSERDMDRWIAGAIRRGGGKFEPLISFELSRGSDGRDGRPFDQNRCALPTPAQYRAAVEAVLKRYKSFKGGDGRPRAFTAWNEPNNGPQPTSKTSAESPEVAGVKRAGEYYVQLRDLCRKELFNCTVAAGDFLDTKSVRAYIEQYKAATRFKTPPAVWALHPYRIARIADGTTRASVFNGLVTEMLGADPGSRKLWITEVGGHFDPANSRTEGQARADLCRAIDLARGAAPVTRFYQYELVGTGTPGVGFDTGLLRGDGTKRSIYDVFAYYSAGRGNSSGCP